MFLNTKLVPFPRSLWMTQYKSTQKRTSIVDGSDHALQHEADVFVVISRPMIHTKAKFHKVAAFLLTMQWYRTHKNQTSR